MRLKSYKRFRCLLTAQSDYNSANLQVVQFGSIFSMTVWNTNDFYLFLQYLKRVTHLTVIAILPCGPLCKHIYIYTDTKII